MLPIELFVFLQVLDGLTTLLGLHLGASEASPFIRMLMSAGPVQGLLVGKLAAFGIGAVCVARRKTRTLDWLNYWSAALVLWNFAVLFRAIGVLS